jgi:Protein of unknown function (DUF3828)
MKRIALFLAPVITLAFFVSGRTVEATRASDPTDTIRSFYYWYVTVLVANHEPMKNRTEMKRFVTDRPLNEIDKMVKGPDGLDGDYFVDAQDFDNKWAKNISVSKVKIHGTRATAEVLLTGGESMNKRLSLDLVNESGAWKINKVQGRE